MLYNGNCTKHKSAKTNFQQSESTSRKQINKANFPVCEYLKNVICYMEVTLNTTLV